MQWISLSVGLLSLGAAVEAARRPALLGRAAVCNADNCLRALRSLGAPAASDCSRLLTPVTVTNAVVTSTSTVFTTPTKTVTQTATSVDLSPTTTTVTSLVTSTITTGFVTTVSVSAELTSTTSFGTITTTAATPNVAAAQKKRQANATPFSLPKYATACSSYARYSSACACLSPSVTASTVTIAQATATIVVTSAASTVTSTVSVTVNGGAQPATTATSIITSVFSTQTTSTPTSTTTTTIYTATSIAIAPATTLTITPTPSAGPTILPLYASFKIVAQGINSGLLIYDSTWSPPRFYPTGDPSQPSPLFTYNPLTTFITVLSSPNAGSRIDAGFTPSTSPNDQYYLRVVSTPPPTDQYGNTFYVSYTIQSSDGRIIPYSVQKRADGSTGYSNELVFGYCTSGGTGDVFMYQRDQLSTTNYNTYQVLQGICGQAQYFTQISLYAVAV